MVAVAGEHMCASKQKRDNILLSFSFLQKRVAILFSFLSARCWSEVRFTVCGVVQSTTVLSI